MKRRLPGGSAVKNPPAMQEPETWIQSLCQEDHLEGMANHSSILALKMPWTEVPRLSSRQYGTGTKTEM